MEYVPLWDFFFNPIFNSSAIGAMFMCFSSALVGVINFVRKRSLLGEALSHASYPGIALGILIFAPIFSLFETLFPIVVLCGAFIAGFLGLIVIHFLVDRLRMNDDTALCFVISSFLGIGILIASRLQFSEPIWYQKVQMYLYGQASTMLPIHVIIYIALAVIIALFIAFTYHRLQLIHFDRTFAKVLSVKTKGFLFLSKTLKVLAIVVGIRSVGVILMAGMLIAPSVAARVFARNLRQMFVIASIIGTISGFLGIYLSVNLSVFLNHLHPGSVVSFPSGPMILIVASLIAIISLLFARERGLISRIYRKKRFKVRVSIENLLKGLYKKESGGSFQELQAFHRLPMLSLFLYLHAMKAKGLMERVNRKWALSNRGKKRAARIVRLHRLWEVYLFDHLGVHAEEVHASAEEMEHILTPDLEKRLASLLNHPQKDPHNQVIPGEE